MNAKHLIWGLTAASLLTPASVGVVRAQAAAARQPRRRQGSSSRSRPPGHRALSRCE